MDGFLGGGPGLSLFTLLVSVIHFTESIPHPIVDSCRKQLHDFEEGVNILRKETRALNAVRDGSSIWVQRKLNVPDEETNSQQ